MFALSFFGIIHVPINVPALALAANEENVDLNRELIAHGVSNTVSGFAGSIQVLLAPLVFLLKLTIIELLGLRQQHAIHEDWWKLSPRRLSPHPRNDRRLDCWPWFDWIYTYKHCWHGHLPHGI